MHFFLSYRPGTLVTAPAQRVRVSETLSTCAGDTRAPCQRAPECNVHDKDSIVCDTKVQLLICLQPQTRFQLEKAQDALCVAWRALFLLGNWICKHRLAVLLGSSHPGKACGPHVH